MILENCLIPIEVRSIKHKTVSQFKINNQILVTNTFLFKIKKKENNLCSYCNQEAESITHLLFHCGTVAKFWKTLKI